MPILWIIGSLIVGAGAAVAASATGAVRLPAPEDWWFFDLGRVDWRFLGRGNTGRTAAKTMLDKNVVGQGQFVVSIRGSEITSLNGHEVGLSVTPLTSYQPDYTPPVQLLMPTAQPYQQA